MGEALRLERSHQCPTRKIVFSLPSASLMDTLVKADIFFFISSIATVVVAIFAVVALVYVIQTAKILKRLSERASTEADKLFTVIYFIRRIIRALS